MSLKLYKLCLNTVNFKKKMLRWPCTHKYKIIIDIDKKVYGGCKAFISNYR